MVAAGTSIFTDIHEYRCAFRDAKIESLYGNVSEFRARLTWVELKWLKLLRVHEHLPHVAFIALSPNSVFVAYPATSHATPTWCGIPLRHGDIAVHALGQRVYEYTQGPATWASISLPPERLATYGRVWAERDLQPPKAGRIYEPSAPAMAHLRRLHAKVCRLVVTRPDIITNKEVVRSLEEELAQALIACLTDGIHRADLHDTSLMQRVDEILTGRPGTVCTIAELCAAADVPENTFFEHCKRLTGMDPSQYIRIRRMNLVRAALRESGPLEPDLATLLSRYGFDDVPRFITQYKAVFGEEPTGRTGADTVH